MLSELDVIELRVAVDSWQPGTVATVLEVRSDSVLAEVADADGRTLDTVVVPLAAIAPSESADISGRPRMSEDVHAADTDESAA